MPQSRLAEPMAATHRSIVVDSHHHFWPQPTPEAYPWMTDELAAIRRPFGPDDLRPDLNDQGVDRTILVQTRSSLDETHELLALAAATDFIAGVVGWVDLTAPNIADTLDEIRARPDGALLVGIRHQAHDEPDPDWLTRPDVHCGLRVVRDAGLVYDLLVRPRELRAALTIAQALPDLPFVIDHIAKPPIRSAQLEPWASLMAPFSELNHVAVKLSGMITEADWRRWSPNDLVPYVERVMTWFGQDRTMFGSDWPVCLLAGSYAGVREALATVLGTQSALARANIFGDNAVRIYGLTEPSAVGDQPSGRRAG